jgi:flagellar biosynthesis protein FliR
MISFTQAQLVAWITPLLWPFLRTLAVFTAMPLFNRRGVPARVRVALAGFTAVALQASLPPMPVIDLDSAVAAMVVMQQVLIGLTIGFAVRVVFACVEYAGELIGLQMGLNFAGFFDPVSATQGTVAASLFSTLVAWTFVAMNGHLLIFQALSQSFVAFPVSDQPFAFLTRAMPWRWGAEIFATGLWIALPLISVLLFVNLVLGFISRVAPTIQVFSVGFPITLSVGLLGLWFLVPALERPFSVALQRLLSSLQ